MLTHNIKSTNQFSPPVRVPRKGSSLHLTQSPVTFCPNCSDRDGYGGGRDSRSYMDRSSGGGGGGGSYRDSFDGYGKIFLYRSKTEQQARRGAEYLPNPCFNERIIQRKQLLKCSQTLCCCQQTFFSPQLLIWSSIGICLSNSYYRCILQMINVPQKCC